MDFRATVVLGRGTINGDELNREAAALEQAMESRGTEGRVSVDPVKATLEVALLVGARDALDASLVALTLTRLLCNDVEVTPPQVVLSFEAEAVPSPVQDALRHQVPESNDA